MPGLLIRPILIIAAVIVSGFLFGENLGAQEPVQSFPTQPKASFNLAGNAANNSAGASNITPAPVPPAQKSAAQLYRFRESLTTSPPAHEASQPKIQNQIQTAKMTGRENTRIQQVAAMEPLPKPLPKPTPASYTVTPSSAFVEAEEIDERNQIAASPRKISNNNNNNNNNTVKENTGLEEIDSNVTGSFLAESNEADGLLDKTIGSGKAKAGNGLLERPKFSGSFAPLISVFGSLLVVISAFFILVLFLKKVSPKGNRQLPPEAFENLGRAALSQKIQLQLLRLGNRLILVSISPDGVTPITEVTDPDEVVPLLGMCRQLDPNSSTEFFRKTINSFSSNKTEGGYFGADVKHSSPKVKSKSKIDLYSEPDESLAEILAKGGQHG